jgi:spore coat protein CotH
MSSANKHAIGSLLAKGLAVAGFTIFLVCANANDLKAQFPGFGGGGPGGPGGPDAPDIELVKDFDADEDGILNKAERAEARKSLKSTAQGARRRGGPGGRRGAGGGQPTGKPGQKVALADAKQFPDAKLYDKNVLRTLFIESDEDDWEQELAEFKPTDVEVPATVTVDGKEYPDVGVSFRGASSFFSIPNGLKRSLNLSMDFINDEQRLYGYKTLNLLNCNGDDSLMSSYLYSRVASEKIAVPKVNFIKVVINGRNWGIYANVQQFNKDMIKENYGTRKGARWKVSGSPRGDGGLRYLGEDIGQYRSRYEIKSKDKTKSWNDLIKLCKVLNETPVESLEAELSSILDIDGVLWFLAVDVALINSDGYWTRASDYSIYQDKMGKFHMLPHDMNESFRAAHGGPGGGGPGGGRGFFNFFNGPPQGGPGGRGGPPRENDGNGPPQTDRDRERRNRGGGRTRGGRGSRGGNRVGAAGDAGYELDPLIGLDQDRFPLRSRLLAVPELRQRYLHYVKTIAQDFIAWEHLGPQVQEARKLIEKEVKKDTRKLMNFTAFQKSTSDSKTAKAGSLQEFAEKRSKYLLEHPAIKVLTK